MERKVTLNPKAEKHLEDLKKDPSKARILKAVSKTLDLMETNLRHPSLNTHPFHGVLVQMMKNYLNHMLKIRLLVHIEYSGIMDLAKKN